METIDMTPTWQEIAYTLATVFRHGNPEGQKHALAELQRMGRLADMASIVLGAHRRPDAPAIPQAEAIKSRLDAFEAIEIWGPYSAARYPVDVLDSDAMPDDAKHVMLRGRSIDGAVYVGAVFGESVHWVSEESEAIALTLKQAEAIKAARIAKNAKCDPDSAIGRLEIIAIGGR